MPSSVRRARDVGAGLVVAAAVLPAAAYPSASVVADTTRGSGDPVAAGRAPTLTAGSPKVLLRFSVSGLTGAPAKAVLRLRVVETSGQALTIAPATEPDFAEDGKAKGGLVLFPPPALVKAKPPAAGQWAEYDVTKAVAGNGLVSFQIAGHFLDPASFSSREGPDAPQLVVTPDDDPVATELGARLDPRNAPVLRISAKDHLGRTLDGIDAVLSPDPSFGRYLGVYHSFLAGEFVAQLATSDDLVNWTHRVDLAGDGGQPAIAVTPAGGIIVADEQDTPDPQWVSVSSLRVRHYPNVGALLVNAFSAEKLIPRSLAPTNEGTPQVSIMRWGTGPLDSELRITFHYLRNIDVDRQAVGTLTNFAAWSAAPDAPTNALLESFGVRGGIGDRSDLVYRGRAFGVIEAQVLKNNHGSWRLFLVDRARGRARLLSSRLPAGGYSLGNPSVTVLPGPSGAPVLFASFFAFSEAAPFEAGSAITVTPLQ